MNSKAKEAYAKAGQIGKNKTEPLLNCYKSILEGAVQHDGTTIESGISLLENALKPQENPKLVYHLIYLYQYMRWCLKSDRYDEVARIAQALLNLWERAIEIHELPEITEPQDSE